MLSDYMSELYTPFEQNLAITWANAHFSSWYQANQNASYEEQQKTFFDCIEGGLSVALEFRKQNT